MPLVYHRNQSKNFFKKQSRLQILFRFPDSNKNIFVNDICVFEIFFSFIDDVIGFQEF